MEGRVVARPNRRQAPRGVRHIGWLQWRAGWLPGQTVVTLRTSPAPIQLQWRAGWLPGQTARLHFGAFDLPVWGRLRAVGEALAAEGS